MTFKVIAPYVSCIVNEVFENTESEFKAAVDAGYQEIYIVTASGIIKHQSLRPGKDGKQRFIRVPVQTIPGASVPKLNVIKPQVNFLPDGKIPIRLLSEIKAFFKKVIEKRGNAVEAMIWIMWNQEAGYHLFVPNQRVSHASAVYDWSSVPVGSSIIVDIHSHADFKAFFSGTDNADDRGSIRYSGVIGHNNTNTQDMVWRFNCSPEPIEATLEDIFEKPVEIQHHVPDTWLDKVQAPLPAPTRSKSPYYPKSSNSHASYLGSIGMDGYSLNGEDDDSRIWKKSYAGRLNHGPWGKTKEILQLEDVNVDPETGVITAVDPKTKTKSSKGKKKNIQSQQSLNLSPEELEGSDEKAVRLLAEHLVKGNIYNPETELINEARENYFRSGAFSEEAQLKASDFNDNVLDYGPEAAFAAEDLSIALEQLVGSDDLLGDLAKKALDMISDSEKLATFRSMYETLPRSAQETLASEGI